MQNQPPKNLDTRLYQVAAVDIDLNLNSLEEWVAQTKNNIHSERQEFIQ